MIKVRVKQLIYNQIDVISEFELLVETERCRGRGMK